MSGRPAAPTATPLRNAARAAGAAALYSEHHFDGTPATDAMADTLVGMADAGADIAKLAVMPHTAADAARLLEATARAHAARPGVPLITMSMGAIGAVTRFCGGGLWQRRHLRRDLWYHRQRPRPALGGGFKRKTICLRPMICRGGLYAARNFPANGCPPYTRGLYTKQKARSLFA